MEMPLDKARALQSALSDVLRVHREFVGTVGCTLLERHISNLGTLIVAGGNSPHFKDSERIIGMLDSAAYNLYHEIEAIAKILSDGEKELPLAITALIEDETFKRLPIPAAWEADDVFDGVIDLESMKEVLQQRNTSRTEASSTTDSEEEDWDAEFNDSPSPRPR